MSPPTILGCIFCAISVFLCGIAIYRTHHDENQCNGYHQDVPATVSSISYTETPKYGIIECQKCQNANIFISCNDKIARNETGSCHELEKNKCKRQEFNWIDEYNLTHREKYTRHLKYNYFKHCTVSTYQQYTISITIKYYINNIMHNHNIISYCQAETCLNKTIQNNPIGSIKLINADNNGIIKNMSCGLTDQTISIWVITVIFILITIISSLCYLNDISRGIKQHKYRSSIKDSVYNQSVVI